MPSRWRLAQGPVHAKRTRPPLVLLVEDHPDTVDYMYSRLVAAGFDVDVARQGDEAQQALESRVPDIVIMDINLPERDGDRIVEDMRQTAVTQDVPVVFLTADSIQRVLHLVDGVTTIFLEKPLSSRAVIDALNRLLGRSSPESSASDQRLGRR